MRASAFSFAYKVAAVVLAALLTFVVLSPAAFAGVEEPQQAADSEVTESFSGPGEVGTSAASLLGQPSAFISSDVALDGEPVVGSFTVDGLTYAVIDGPYVELVGVAPSDTAVSDDGVLSISETVACEGVSHVVTSIAPYAFYLSGVTSVTLPASVSDVDDRAFRSSDVASVTVAEGNPIYSSFDGALYDAEQLSLLLIPEGKQGTVRIPKTAEVAEASVFSHCPLVDSISVDAGSAAFASENGLLYDASLTTLLRVPAGATDITIREGCTIIAVGALEACAKLTTINAPSSVTAISPDIFTAIPTVSLPAASLAGIDDLDAPGEPTSQDAAPQLTAVVTLSAADSGLPESAPSSIDLVLPWGADTAPWQATGFSVASADEGGYPSGIDIEENSGLADPVVLAQAADVYAVTSGSFSTRNDQGSATWALDDAGVLAIECQVMSGGELPVIDVSYAEGQQPWFAVRDSIASVVFKNVDAVNTSYWFAGCSNLRNVSVVDTTKKSFLSLTWCSSMFLECTGLTVLPVAFLDVLPRAVNLTSLGSMFKACSNISGTIPATFTLKENTNLNYIGHLFEGCNRLSGSIPRGLDFSTLTKLQSTYAMFSGCRSLTGSIPPTMTFANNPELTDIGGTFLGCSGLSGGIPSGMTFAKNSKLEYAGSVFKGCSNLTGSIPSEMTFASNPKLKSLASLFSGCSQLTGKIPEGMTFANNPDLELANAIFYNWVQLGIDPQSGESRYGIPSGMTLDDKPNLTSTDSMFRLCSSLTGAIPDRLLSFRGCSNLVATKDMFTRCYLLEGPIPSTLTFGDCTSLADCSSMFFMCENLTGPFPQNLTFEKNLGLQRTTSMFHKCQNLFGSIPSGMTFAKSQALISTASMFNGCKGLTGSIPQDMTFANNKELQHVYAMFDGCSGLTGSIPQGMTFETNLQLERTDSLFRGCSGLTGSIPFKMTFGANSKMVQVGGMFSGCSGLTGTIPAMKLGSLGSLTIATRMLYGCTGLVDIAVGFTMPKAGADVTEMFQVGLDDTAVASGRADGTVDLNGNLVTTYAGADAATLGLDWTSMGRSLGSSRYTVSFDANGGAGSITPPLAGAVYNSKPDARNGAVYRVPDAELAKTGYLFDGWARSSVGEKAYGPDGTFSNLGKAGAKVLYAHFAPIAYTIAFDSSGGPAVSDIYAVYDQEVELPGADYDGYVLRSWLDKGTGASYEPGPAKNLADVDGAIVTLTAQWAGILSADVPLEVVARIDVLGIEAPSEASGYIESRSGEPLEVASISFSPLPGATEVFRGRAGEVRLEVLAGEGAVCEAAFALDAAVSGAVPAAPSALLMQGFLDRVPISYRFVLPLDLQTSLAELPDSTPVCSVTYTVALT